MSAILSGPLFESSDGALWTSVHRQNGGHYNTFCTSKGVNAMAALREFFPDGKADEMNFALFSTSGVHGHYGTIEDCEPWIGRPDPTEDSDEYANRDVTFVIVQPRLCTIRYGNVEVKTKDDIKFLKKLRASSWKAVAKIGAAK